MSSLWEPHISAFIFKVKELGIETFIETGTHTGAGALWASDHFKRVLSIELNKTFYEKAKEKYKHRSNIEFYHGDSKDVLPVVLESVEEPALLWLDAHFWPELYETNPDLDLPYSGCPLMDELNAIILSPYRHFILIDDTGCFDYRQPEWAYDWPTIAMIRDRIKDRGYHIEVKVDQIAITPEDMIVPFLTAPELFMQQLQSSLQAQTPNQE